MYRTFDKPDKTVTLNAVTSGCLSPWSYTVTTQRVTGMASGQPVPQYFRKRKRGELIPFTAFARVDSTWTGGWWRYQIFQPSVCGVGQPVGKSTSMFNLTLGVVRTSDYLLEEAREYLAETDALVNDAIAALGGRFDVLTFLAELRESADMLLGLGGRVRKHMSKKPNADSAASVWLEWRFGWRPLYADLDAIVDLLNRNHARPKIEHVFRRKSLEKSITTDPITSVSDGQGSSTTWAFTEKWDVRLNGHAAGLAAYFDKHNTFTLPAVTAWELVPYSFVLDKVLDVGSWIQAMSVALLAPKSALTSSGGVNVQFRQEASVISTTPGPTLASFKVAGGHRQLATVNLRQPKGASFPSFDWDVSAKDIIDVIALLIQRLYRLLK